MLEKVKLKLKNLDFAYISASTIICTLITFLYNLLTKRVVMPFEYGIYSACSMVLNYTAYLQLGVLNAYNRDYPQLLGSGEYEKAHKVKNVVFTYFTIIYSITGVLICLVVLPLWLCGVIDTMFAIGLFITALLALITTAFSYFDITARMDDRFAYSSIVNIVKAVILLGVGLPAVYLLRSPENTQYYGIYIGVVFSNIAALLMYIKTISSMRFSFDKNIIKGMIISGLPLLINGFIWTVMGSVDRFVIMFMMEGWEAKLGLYSTALLGFSTLVVIPSSFTQVFYIKMSHKYGETKSKDVLLQYAKDYTLIISLLTSIISVVAYFFLPVFIKAVLPEYVESIRSAQIITIGVAFYATAMLFSNIMCVLKWNTKLLIFTSSLCVLNTVFSTSFVALFGTGGNSDINMVAYGTSLSYLIYSLILIVVLAVNMKSSVLQMLKVSWFPVVCTISPCLLFDYFNIFDFSGWGDFAVDLFRCVISLFIGMVAVIIFLKNQVKRSVMLILGK
ncbi:MAG: hypothetical protein DBX47_05080 [Clostridiales bacterium]|nr:MAG: hypothetical protein DBX47_05080 [Clostridiales bacterium]